MLAAAFDFKLDHEVKGNLVTIGKCKYRANYHSKTAPL